ncbi:MAG: hydrogenase expression/formation protein HypE, partial [Thermoplasmata archaeon]
MEKLIRSLLPQLHGVGEGEVPLRWLEDASVVGGVALTIDSYTVRPIFFPGGDLGRLSVCGTVNDLSVMGAEPRALAISLVAEEGLDSDVLDAVFASAGDAAREA